MNPFQLYNDIQVDIEVLQDQIEACMNERKQWLAGGRLFNTVTLDNAFLRVDKLSEKIEAYEEELSVKVKMKFSLEEKLSKYIGLEYKVAYMRQIEGKSLVQISNELDYSYQYIKEISAKISKKHTENIPTY